MTVKPITDAERALLRRLYLAGTPGPWRAYRVGASGESRVVQDLGDDRELIVALPNRLEDAELMAAARNALPRLFAEIDELRARARPRRTIPILGTVG